MRQDLLHPIDKQQHPIQQQVPPYKLMGVLHHQIIIQDFHNLLNYYIMFLSTTHPDNFYEQWKEYRKTFYNPEKETIQYQNNVKVQKNL